MPSPVTSAEPIVRFERVTKRFGSQLVLSALDLSIHAGQTTVVLGPSGTGKSVLLKHIVGLLRPDSGAVLFEGSRIDQMSEKDLVALRRQVGFLFQMGALFDSMTVWENVAFPLVEHTSLTAAQRRERVRAALEMVDLPGVSDRMPASLSGGQRKRVALARAIVLEPRLLLYDEPTTGLDPITADIINRLIRHLADRLRVTSVVVTHDLVSAMRIADRVLMLYDGVIHADDPPHRFIAGEDPLVRRFVRTAMEPAMEPAGQPVIEPAVDTPPHTATRSPDADRDDHP